MATMKSYTDIEQSRKLAEILPPKSADMCWYIDNNNIPTHTPDNGFYRQDKNHLPCWSLAALFNVLPEINDIPLTLEKVKAEDGYEGYYYHIEYKDKILIPYNDNPIDACVEMIEQLYELNLL